ncbi:motility associated factor glycosyltransferase family protein [Natroniella sp. ANB-PHB2]|uniref:motility associated factor glycosyltransferase family protein n=1 Tax=Natroniella sp. ANB-PHB2 TaxID=3384444 RepID=UPI0038D38223
MTSLYNKNVKCLDDNTRNLVLNLKQDSKFDVLDTKSGDLSLKIGLKDKELLLNSHYNPRREAKRFIANYNLEEVASIILIGFGLGYYVEELLNKLRRDQSLKIVVVNSDIFKFALKNRDLELILKDRRVELIIGVKFSGLINKLQGLFNKLDILESKLIFHEQSIKVMPNEFLALRDVLEKIKVNRYNNRRLGKRIRKNIIENLSFINESLGVSNFKEAFLNKPIFIIAAGPSLDENIKQLKSIRDKGIIIAVDTALIPLLTEWIRPDFIVSIEPVKNSYKFFKDYLNLEIPLVHSLGIHPKILKDYQGPKTVGFAKSDLLMDCLSKLINKGRIATGGSVASTALDFAMKLGGDPVVFVGQDFAFSKQGITHAENTSYEQRKRDNSTLRQVEGINGDQVYTSTDYYLYLRWFERYIADNSQVNYIDATEGGAKIRGTKILSLKETIFKYCKSEINKSEIIANIFSNTTRECLSDSDIKRFIGQINQNAKLT